MVLYVPTTTNPADLATWPQTPRDLVESKWFQGPDFLHRCDLETITPELVPGEQLPEYRPIERIMKTTQKFDSPLSTICNKLSQFSKIIGVTSVLANLQMKFDKVRQRLGIKLAPRSETPNSVYVELLHVQNTQSEVFKNDMSLLQQSQILPVESKIIKFDPFLDHLGIVRVGGRLKRAHIPFTEQHPILLPGEHPFAYRLVEFIHQEVHHQRFKITLGALTQRGYVISNGNGMIKKLIYFCVTCRRLRGKPQTQ